MQEPFFMEALYESGGNGAMNLTAMTETAALIYIKADVVRIERCLLA